jgi:hypothetical protein
MPTIKKNFVFNLKELLEKNTEIKWDDLSEAQRASLRNYINEGLARETQEMNYFLERAKNLVDQYAMFFLATISGIFIGLLTNALNTYLIRFGFIYIGVLTIIIIILLLIVMRLVNKETQKLLTANKLLLPLLSAIDSERKEANKEKK